MIIAIGDVHGKFYELQRKIEHILGWEDTQNGTHFVQIGDFGMGFDIKSTYNDLRAINDVLAERDSRLYIIRGNHDNPSFWNVSAFKFSNIDFITDGSIRELDGRVCLFSGGGMSIDRTRRIQGVTYWPTEGYNHRDIEYNGRIDVVFTHEIYHPISNFTLANDLVQSFCEIDEDLMDDLVMNQEEMGKLARNIRDINGDVYPYTWIHGHYHQHSVRQSDNIKVICLAELETMEVTRL